MTRPTALRATVRSLRLQPRLALACCRSDKLVEAVSPSTRSAGGQWV
ncbi:hypothetical protein ACFV5N_02260 [Streptomyces sp. NPDC059853]